jgi:hypothetical protein
MNTLSILNILIGVLNSRKGKFNLTGGLPNQPINQNPNQNPNLLNPTAAPAMQQAPGSTGQAIDPLNPAPSGLAPQTQGQQPQPEQVPLQPQAAMNQPPHSAEQQLRQQLGQVDLYDLSGEKAAAEALKHEDAFKQQQIGQKAEQTKNFFAEQDRKQQESFQEMQKQADQQLQQQRDKEFWDQKQMTEMQAGMNKELLGLHEAARQAHQEWRTDFSQGICREDAAALYNKDIDSRVGAYKQRLDDIGSNPVDAAETAAKYKVKLQDEVAPQIEQKTAEMHQEHFPEYSGGDFGNHIERHGPDGHAPDHLPQHSHLPESPENHLEEQAAAKVGKSGPGITNPEGGRRADMPGLGGREAIRSSPGGSGPSSGSGSGAANDESKPGPGSGSGGSDADDSAYAAFSARAKLEAQTEKANQDAPEGFFKDIDAGKSTWARLNEMAQPRVEKVQQFGDAVREIEYHAIGEKGIEHAVGAIKESNLSGVAEGVLDGVAPEMKMHVSQMAKDIYHAGPEGVIASAQLTADKIAANAQSMAEQADKLGAKLDSMGQAAGAAWDKASDAVAEKINAAGQAMGEHADKVSATLNEAAQSTQQKWESLRAGAKEAGAKMGEAAKKFINDESGSVPMDKVQEPGMKQGSDQPSSLNPNLVDMYKQRQLDLGKTDVDQSVQKFAENVKQIDQQAQAPTPAPAIAAPAPAPVPAPAPAPAPAAPAPAAAPAAPAPASAPAAPSQAPAAPSMSPSL